MLACFHCLGLICERCIFVRVLPINEDNAICDSKALIYGWIHNGNFYLSSHNHSFLGGGSTSARTGRASVLLKTGILAATCFLVGQCTLGMQLVGGTDWANACQGFQGQTHIASAHISPAGPQLQSHSSRQEGCSQTCVQVGKWDFLAFVFAFCCCSLASNLSAESCRWKEK